MNYHQHDYAVVCKHCGSDLEYYYRIRKTYLQQVLFPGGMHFKCSNCSKKTFVPRLEKYRQHPT